MSVAEDRVSRSRIDLHSHLLPGVDDGCQSLEESIRCVQNLIQWGFTGSVCTPHLWPNMYPQNTPFRVGQAVAQLREQLHQAELRYHVWPGGELRIAEDTIDWIESVGVPTLGSGHCVLVDYWGTSWPSFADELIQYLLDRDYQPILAHPERLGIEDSELDDLLRSLEERGVWLQGNFNSLSGGEGPAAAERIRRWLAEDRYSLLALDMHGADSLEGRFAGLSLAERHIGREKVTTLLEERPWAILSGAESPLRLK